MSATQAPPVDTATRVPVTSIRLRRAEGPAHVDNTWHDHAGNDAWDAARSTLQHWALTAPTDGTVDKVDFTVTYADGQTYNGTFGLTATDTCLGEHMRAVCRHVIANASGLNDPCDIRDAAEFLDRYQIGR